MTLVTDLAHYEPALDGAFAHSESVLVEDYIELGREVRCCVLAFGGELVCLPLEEYDVNTATRPIRGWTDKIGRAGDGELELVAKDATRAWIVDPHDPITHDVCQAGKTCHKALGCRHYCLFDFRIDPDGQPWFLEAGLYCSFARQSVIATMAAAAGIPLEDLFRTALDEASRPDHDDPASALGT